MVRAARPSDVYRLPEEAGQPRKRPQVQPQPPPPHRFPAWLGVAGVLAVVLVISGVVLGGSAPTTGDAPLVDIVSEDQAIAALTLYGAEAGTIGQLVERREILDAPGPADAARIAGQGAAAVQEALESARAVPNPDPLAAAYWNDGDHAVLAQRLTGVQGLADLIALLANTHDTLYSGTGSVVLADAYPAISSALAGGGYPAAVRGWARALLEQMDERDHADIARRARARTQRLWAEVVTALEPAAVPALVDYLNGLPAVTVDGLRGHPVAGPALRMLERQSRDVSGQQGSRSSSAAVAT